MLRRSVIRLLRAAVIAWSTLGFAAPATAQTLADAEKLNAEVLRLRHAGKIAEAMPLAQQALAIREAALGPDHPDVATSLNNLAHLHENQGRFAEAEQLHKRSLAIWEATRGPQHPSTATSLNNLAALYEQQGRYAEAEPLYLRSLTIRETVLGPNHPDVATTLNNFAGLLASQSRYTDAEALYTRSLAIRDTVLGPNHPEVAISLNNLAELYRSLGRYAEAERLYTRSLAINEAVFGPEHPEVALSLNNLAALYRTLGRYSEVEPAYRRSLAILEKEFGPQHPRVATSLHNLAELYVSLSRYAEAEPLYKRSLAIREMALGFEHSDVSTSLNNLALLYEKLGHYEEAELLYKRGLATDEKTLGAEHTSIASSLNNLAALYFRQGRNAEAEPLYLRSLAISEKALGPDHPDVASALSNLGLLYEDEGRYAEAERLFNRSLAIKERELGPDHPDVGISLSNLAVLYESMGRYAEAETLVKRAHSNIEKALGPDHPDAGTLLGNLATLALRQNDVARAAQNWRKAAMVLQRQAGRGLDTTSMKTAKREARRGSWHFEGLVKTTHRLTGGQVSSISEMFEMAQWAQASEAAGSLAQMAARSASETPALSALARERQDLVNEWEIKDKLLITFKSEPPMRRNAAAEAALAERLVGIEHRRAEIDAHLAAAFPEYAALANPRPIKVLDVQDSLSEDEALVFFLDTTEYEPLPEETFIWVITKQDHRWFRSDFGSDRLQREVAALRCGLDATAWYGDGAINCSKLLRVPLDRAPKDGQPPPFDAARAYALYKSLLGEAEDLIKGKSLLVVPSGPLTKLPFQVLVTALPSGVIAGEASRVVGRLGVEFGPLSQSVRQRLPGEVSEGVLVVKLLKGSVAETAGLRVDDVLLSVDGTRLTSVPEATAILRGAGPGRRVTLTVLRDSKQFDLPVVLETATIKEWTPLFVTAANQSQIRWLARDHAVTVLPSVSAVKSLRRVAKPSKADRSMIGFGNPLLNGSGRRHLERARAARERVVCQSVGGERMAALVERRGGEAVETRGGVADVIQLKARLPLPETAEELCAVARDLGADPGDVRLGPNATETEIKRLSATGDLARYRILHFATHGTLAGQLSGTSEPGLILTPPETPSADDDGYLSGSEIANLKLDADWVILSACNTAAGDDAANAEALSGLARVFFYAGARALLVSHWEVNSVSTVKLIASAIGAMSKDKTVGRAEALRRSMLAMLDKGEPHEAHPAYWAPFVVVGEGAPAAR